MWYGWSFRSHLAVKASTWRCLNREDHPKAADKDIAAQDQRAAHRFCNICIARTCLRQHVEVKQSTPVSLSCAFANMLSSNFLNGYPRGGPSKLFAKLLLIIIIIITATIIIMIWPKHANACE